MLKCWFCRLDLRDQVLQHRLSSTLPMMVVGMKRTARKQSPYNCVIPLAKSTFLVINHLVRFYILYYSLCVVLTCSVCVHVSTGSYELSCQRNPLVVNVTHNLSLPFYQTSAVQLNFSSSQVAVLAVALRTSCHFSAFALTGCAEGGVSHNLQTHTCMHIYTQTELLMLFTFQLMLRLKWIWPPICIWMQIQILT